MPGIRYFKRLVTSIPYRRYDPSCTILYEQQTTHAAEINEKQKRRPNWTRNSGWFESEREMEDNLKFSSGFCRFHLENSEGLRNVCFTQHKNYNSDRGVNAKLPPYFLVLLYLYNFGPPLRRGARVASSEYCPGNAYTSFSYATVEQMNEARVSGRTSPSFHA